MMKRLVSTSINQRYLDIAILIIRVCIACFMFTHGMKKMEKFFSDEPIKFADPLGIGENASLVLTVFAEYFCSILLFFGLFTRVALIPLLICMVVIIFVFHAGDPFEKREDALLYILPYIILLATGGGKYSLDKVIENYLISRK